MGTSGERILIGCAVLYLDMLESARWRAVPRPNAVVAAVFSDSFVAAAPVERGFREPRAAAIANLLFEAASIQSVLALNNYFVRGAVTVGECHFDRGLIFGPALVEAVGLEQEIAIDPRIVGESIEREPILVDEDGLTFVDYLAQLYQDPRVTAKQNLGDHRRVVAKNLKKHATDMHRWRKHRWIAEYHNDFIGRHEDELIESKVNVANLKIDIVDANGSYAR